MAEVVLTVCAFNNKGYPKIATHYINKGDYMVRDQINPDILLEQERWHLNQWPGFKKIFSAAYGYDTHRPKASVVSGTIVANKTTTLRSLFQFSKLAHVAVPGVCNYRNYTGRGVLIKGTQYKRRLTYASIHLTPSAFSARFPSGSRRRRLAQRAWYAGMRRLKGFAHDQIVNGKRDFVVIGGDFNAKRWRLEEYFGKSIGGKPVHIFTSQHGYKIDHIVVIGHIRFIEDDFLNGTPSDHAPFWVKFAVS